MFPKPQTPLTSPELFPHKLTKNIFAIPDGQLGRGCKPCVTMLQKPCASVFRERKTQAPLPGRPLSATLQARRLILPKEVMAGALELPPQILART